MTKIMITCILFFNLFEHFTESFKVNLSCKSPLKEIKILLRKTFFPKKNVFLFPELTCRCSFYIAV